MTNLLTARHFFWLLIVPAILFSCQSNPHQQAEAEAERRTTEVPVLSTGNLPAQRFTISAQSDTVIKGKSGTLLRIYKNTFVAEDGKPVTGNIDIELQEAFTPEDIMLSGLTTTSDGQLLETGGMIYVNASAGERPLELANDQFIGVIAPSANLKKGMKIFEGKMDSNGVNWTHPQAILNDKLTAQASLPKAAADSAPVKVKEGSKSDLDAIFDYIESDTSKPERQNLVKKQTKAAKKRQVEKTEEDVFLNEIRNGQGTNLFLEDYNTNYIFSLKQLGWANIDRLYEDPRTREVEFITAIDNHKDFSRIYITLIIGGKSMYIPGYQRKDRTFSFTHSDEEAAQLPVGETATILATAYKHDKPYYAIKTIKIAEKQTISIGLAETTSEKLKEALSKGI